MRSSPKPKGETETESVCVCVCECVCCGMRGGEDDESTKNKETPNLIFISFHPQRDQVFFSLFVSLSNHLTINPHPAVKAKGERKKETRQERKQ